MYLVLKKNIEIITDNLEMLKSPYDCFVQILWDIKPLFAYWRSFWQCTDCIAIILKYNFNTFFACELNLVYYSKQYLIIVYYPKFNYYFFF